MFSTVGEMFNFFQRLEGLEYAYESCFDIICSSLPEENRTTYVEFMKHMPPDVKEYYDHILAEEKKGNFIPYF